MQYLCQLQAEFRNLGGFHLIGSGRDKIEKEKDLEQAASVVKELDLDGLVVCGGDDSNTNAAVLAENFAAKGELLCCVRTTLPPMCQAAPCCIVLYTPRDFVPHIP